jgi:hypothetical protein
VNTVERGLGGLRYWAFRCECFPFRQGIPDFPQIFVRVVINEHGNVARALRRVKPEGHAERVLEALPG